MLIQKGNWSLQKIDGKERYRYLQTPATSKNRTSENRRKKSRSVSFGMVKETEEISRNCPGYLNVVFSPQEYFLFSDSFPQMKQELLDLQIKKRFQSLAITLDNSDLSHRCHPNPGKTRQLDCIFVHNEDTTSSLTALSRWKGVNNARLIPAPIAIATLFNELTENAVLILLLEQDFSQVIVVKDGILLYNQMLAQAETGIVETSLIPNAVDFARVSVRNDYNIDKIKITVLGEARKSIDLNDFEIKEWKPDFSSFIKTGIDTENILSYPQLYGAHLVPEEWNFMPKEYTAAWTLQKWSKRATLLASIIILLAGTAWALMQPMIKEERALYQARQKTLAVKKQEIEARMPQEQALNNFAEMVQIRSKYVQDFRIDLFLEKLAQALPDHVLVQSIEISRLKPAAASSPNLSEDDAHTREDAEMQLQQETANVSLHGRSSGTYLEISSRFEKMVRNLGMFFSVRNATWSYNEQTTEGELACNLLPPGYTGEIKPNEGNN